MAWNYIGPTGLTGRDFLMVVLIFEALQDFKGRVMEKLVIRGVEATASGYQSV